MKTNEQLSAQELMGILANQLRKLADMELTDRNISKCIAQSKEVGNLAGKAIALSHYELEKQRIGIPSKALLIEATDSQLQGANGSKNGVSKGQGHEKSPA